MLLHTREPTKWGEISGGEGMLQNKHETDLAKVQKTAGAFSRLLRHRSCREHVCMSSPPQKRNPATDWAKEVSMCAVYSYVF